MHGMRESVHEYEIASFSPSLSLSGNNRNDSFTLPETDSGMDSDSDSKPDSYIVL